MKTSRMFSVLRVVVLVAACELVCRASTKAQDCDSIGTLVFTHPGARMYSIHGNDTLDPGLIVPGYRFEFQNDSLSFHYNVREFQHNQKWIMLDTWCSDRMYNWSSRTDSDTNEHTSASLSHISRTKTILIEPGDTISFVKDSYWMYHDVPTAGFTHLHAPKWFGVSVHIVDSSNSSTVWRMDSIRLNSYGPSVPCVSMTSLMIDRLTYVHPPTAESVHAYVGIRLHEGGGGIGKWYRTDKIEFAFSGHELADSNIRGRFYTNAIEQHNVCGYERNGTVVYTAASWYDAGLVLKSDNASVSCAVYVIDGRKVLDIEHLGSPRDLERALQAVPSGLYVAVLNNNGEYQRAVMVSNIR